MRTFIQGNGPGRKIVRIEVQGRRMTVLTGRADGPLKQNEKDLGSDAGAAHACDNLVREVLARGFVEQPSPAARPVPVETGAKAEDGEAEYLLVEESEAPVIADAPPVLPRLGPRPETDRAGEGKAATSTKPRKKKKRKKKDGEKRDWVAILGISGVSALMLGLVGFLLVVLLKPPTLTGTWAGSKVTHEIGKMLRYDHYRMTLDDRGRVSLILQQEYGLAGTYRVDGDRLQLALIDEDGYPQQLEYRFRLSRTDLALFEPDGDLIVRLIRTKEMDAVPEPAPPRPAEVVGPADDELDDLVL